MVYTLAVGDALLKHCAAIVAHGHNSPVGKRSSRHPFDPRYTRSPTTILANPRDEWSEHRFWSYVQYRWDSGVARNFDDTTEEETGGGFEEFHYG